VTGLLLLALAGTPPAQASEAGATLTLVGARASNGHRPIHKGLSAWARFPLAERSFDVEAELTWATQNEEFIGVNMRTHLVRPSAGLTWSTGSRRTLVSAHVGLCLNLYAGGLNTVVAQVRPGLRTRIGVDMPLGERMVVRWHFGFGTRGLSADVDTALGVGVRL